MTLGQNIQNARRAQGLSQEALAEKIGVAAGCTAGKGRKIMCGIAGFIAGHGAANAAALAPMLARIAHRGPDGQGTFVEGPAALGHCRLAIIDLEGGAQPLYSEDKNLVVVFNGEIYNYRALTAELTALGHTFATRTDTEVLLHGWEQWGRELLPRLRGMFAFALWDRRAGVLFCARDMFGIKPLYYCR